MIGGSTYPDKNDPRITRNGTNRISSGSCIFVDRVYLAMKSPIGNHADVSSSLLSLCNL